MLFQFLESFNTNIPIGENNNKPGEYNLVKVEAPFTDEISSLAIVKLLDKLAWSVIMLIVKFFAKCCCVRYN